MQHLIRFTRFWYDFIVGDDWLVAVGVVAAVLATGLIVRAGVPAWWVIPLSVPLVLGVSLGNVSRRSG